MNRIWVSIYTTSFIMNLLKIYFCTLIAALTLSAGLAQPKREFRGVWVASVSNLDFPSSRTLTPAQQRNEFTGLLNQLQQAGINAVLMQVRPSCDALYPTAFDPWSEFLTGKQGQAPSPAYDPLAFMIGECRRRGMEFHAWFNPYRAVIDARTAKLDSTRHVAIRRPEWILPYGNLRILNPGLPEVRDYVTAVVMDVLRRYDVDGIHFDDYFYPYPETGLTLNDDAAYQQHNRNIVSRADWRRDNVNLLIKMVHDSVAQTKPWVKFGVSPFGIWQNFSAAQPLGSMSRGLESYSAIYCDSRKWAEQGWVDYLVPQLYWTFGNSAADYGQLAPWWSRNVFNRHLYIGHGAYQINNPSNTRWQNPAEVPNQVRSSRGLSQVRGGVFFRAKSVTANPLGFRDSMRLNLYAVPSLQPQMSWKDTEAPPAPQQLTVDLTLLGAQLRWRKPQTGSGEVEKIRGYAVYRFSDPGAVDVTRAQALIAITPTDTTSFTDPTVNLPPNTTYVITALDRLHNESAPSNPAVLLPTTSTDEATAALSEIRVYPNPFDDICRVEYRLDSPSTVAFSLFDATGRLVFFQETAQQPAGAHILSIRVGHLPAGLYIGQARTVGGIYAFKAVKN